MTTFEERFAERRHGTMLELVGLRFVEVNERHALLEMPFRSDLAQFTGVFHAGALLTLADTAATAACLHAIDPTGADGSAPFPLAVQVSANLIRNTGAGIVTAESVLLHRGRTTMVAETKVRDDQGRVLVAVTSTHMVLPGR